MLSLHKNVLNLLSRVPNGRYLEAKRVVGSGHVKEVDRCGFRGRLCWHWLTALAMLLAVSTSTAVAVDDWGDWDDDDRYDD